MTYDPQSVTAPSGSAPTPRNLAAKAIGRGVERMTTGELLSLASGMTLREARTFVRESPATLARRPASYFATMTTSKRAAALAAAFELGRRANELAEPGLAIRGPEDVLKVVSDLAQERQEHFVALLLDAHHCLTARKTISIGSLTAAIVHPREVFAPAILASAASLIVVHNHPSGDPEPSEEDVSLTRRLVEVGELVGIAILDHVIVASRGIVSFRARQLL